MARTFPYWHDWQCYILHSPMRNTGSMSPSLSLVVSKMAAIQSLSCWAPCHSFQVYKSWSALLLVPQPTPAHFQCTHSSFCLSPLYSFLPSCKVSFLRKTLFLWVESVEASSAPNPVLLGNAVTSSPTTASACSNARRSRLELEYDSKCNQTPDHANLINCFVFACLHLEPSTCWKTNTMPMNQNGCSDASVSVLCVKWTCRVRARAAITMNGHVEQAKNSNRKHMDGGKA
ncbi:hypothetical protein B0H10DRAFT_313875 [Mycena sp. CBHHK59/15]|nr:hypothetical protein B0H10DRAFT_313875 [Mycena sp. CBHHK59/15]